MIVFEMCQIITRVSKKLFKLELNNLKSVKPIGAFIRKYLVFCQRLMQCQMFGIQEWILYFDTTITITKTSLI